MLKTVKMNQKNITDGAVKIVSAVSGVMAGGALQNAIPLDKSYGNMALTAGGSVLGILVDDKSTSGTVVKYMGLGLATRSLYEIIKDKFQASIPEKAEGEELTMVDKLVRGAVGLSNPADAYPFLAAPTINFDDYPEAPASPSSNDSVANFLA